MEENTQSPAETINQEAYHQANNTDEAQVEAKEQEVDYKKLYEAQKAHNERVEAERKKAETSPNLNNESTADLNRRLAAIEETKRQEDFADEHGLSVQQARWLFSNIAKPSADSLKDVAVKAALEAIGREQRLGSNIPGSRNRAAFKSEAKSFSQSTKQEREKWFKNVVQKHQK